MREFLNFSVMLLLLVFLVLGCSNSGNETITVKVAEDPLANVRTLLEGYAKGQPMRSEVTSFPDYVNTVRKVDPAKADILEKGFSELQKSGANHQAKAKELLEKLK